MMMNNVVLRTKAADKSQFRQVVANFAQKEIAPRAAEIDKTNRMPEVRIRSSLSKFKC